MSTQADAEVLSVRREGAYYHLSFAAPGIADGFRPDRWDITGAAVCLAGVGLIMYAPR